MSRLSVIGKWPSTRAGRLSGRATFLGVLVTVSVLAAGCDQGRDEVHLYEAGVYKGIHDPLLKALANPELQSKLHQRFETVQARQ